MAENINQGKSNWLLADKQNSKIDVDKNKFIANQTTENIENCIYSKQVETIRSENNDIEDKNNYSNILGKCSQESQSTSNNEGMPYRILLLYTFFPKFAIEFFL